MIRTGSAPHPTFGDALSPVDRAAFGLLLVGAALVGMNIALGG